MDRKLGLTKMIRFVILVCFLGAAVAAPSDLPPKPRSKEEVEEYRRFLEDTVTNNASLEDTMARYPWSSPWENSGKFQGDILLTKEQIDDMVSEYANPGGNRHALRRPGGLWPGRVIVWDFGPGFFNAQQQQQIQASFHLFNTRTCVRFRRRRNENSWVRVTGYRSGCWAVVGHQAGRVTGMNIAPGCFNPYVIFHEWLHVVGFYHTQSTYNRYDYVGINWYNIIYGTQHNFGRMNANQVDNLRLPYEYASNMHYGAYFFSRNGRPTITARRPGGHMMGHLSHVTGWDILRINRLYGCPGAWARSTEEPYYFEEQQSLENEKVMEQEQAQEQEQVVEQEQVMEQEEKFEEEQ